MAPRWSTSLLQFRLGLSLLSLLAAPSLGRLPRLPDGEVVDENNLVEGAPQPLSLSDAARLFVRLNQEEEQGARSEGQEEREDARLIGITDGGLYRGDLVVYLPVTLLLPTFAFRSRYSLAGSKDSSWRSYLFGRSYAGDRDVGDEDAWQDIRGPVDRVLSRRVKYDPQLPEYEDGYVFWGGRLVVMILLYQAILKEKCLNSRISRSPQKPVCVVRYILAKCSTFWRMLTYIQKVVNKVCWDTKSGCPYFSYLPVKYDGDVTKPLPVFEKEGEKTKIGKIPIMYLERKAESEHLSCCHAEVILKFHN
ncbi:uncharacterized protein LOC122248892 [Penaeus japonicus]|uniref:uncharacterized protein LOC122248892 n=1 Tax=Penaeus japonicus TaxID=27405 RepID=UPI001C70B55D|nr:uncharacterized protein LOC122248892 [Penaeus japonicus]